MVLLLVHRLHWHTTESEGVRVMTEETQSQSLSSSEAARPRADAAGGSGRDNGGDAGDEDGGAADGETHYKNRSPSEYTLDDIEF